MESIRWAFNTRLWTPSKADWMLALSYIQAEEKERIGKFVFKKDAKSSIAGRLMLRKLATEVLDLPWAGTEFGRTEKGRPYLVSALSKSLEDVDFNVSHQGSWAVLAAELGKKVGVDVMEVEYTGGKSQTEFFHTMRRQFTAEEWSQIYSFSMEKDQLASFYRHWCLKEGVVKALGVGIGFELQRVSFQLKTPELKMDNITVDTEVKIDGELDTAWHFEETLIDPCHSVAVALKNHQSQASVAPEKLPTSFSVLSFEDMIENGEVITEPDEAAALEFMEKSETPW